jgi:hypothetical protein
LVRQQGLERDLDEDADRVGHDRLAVEAAVDPAVGGEDRVQVVVAGLDHATLRRFRHAKVTGE